MMTRGNAGLMVARLLLAWALFIHGTWGDTAEWLPDTTTMPQLAREGAVAVSTEQSHTNGTEISMGHFLHIAGGRNALFGPTLFSDIYTYDIEKNIFTKSGTSLPEGLYNGEGGEYQNKMFIYSGLTSSISSPLSASPSSSATSTRNATYFADMYVVDFSSSMQNAPVSRLTLSPPITPRQLSTSLVVGSTFYLFGGVTGDDGVTAVPDPFVAIDLDSGITRILPCADDSCPANAPIRPLMNLNWESTKIYVYPCMNSSGQFPTESPMLYTFDLTAETWDTPVTMPEGPTNCAGSGRAKLHKRASSLAVVGGWDPLTGSSSISSVWYFGTFPPVVSQSPIQLAFNLSNMVVGLNDNDNIYIYGGANYAATGELNSNPTYYNHGVMRLVPATLTEEVEAHCPFEELCHLSGYTTHTSHVLLAFALTGIAGLSTTLGALITFLPYVHIGNNICLIAGLAAAGGVMLFVSFAEMLPGAGYYLCCAYPNHYTLFGTVTFFIGIGLAMVLDVFLHWLKDQDQRILRACGYNSFFARQICCYDRANPMSHKEDYEEITDSIIRPQYGTDSESDYEPYPGAMAYVHGTSADRVVSALEGPSTDRMTHMGILTGLALAIHNFPEGIATFTATMAEPSLGVALSFAIALHNIPEGIAIAMPLYYGTGSKGRALFWSFASGMAEPLGALFAWILLSDVIGPRAFGIIFGIVGGVMTYIALHELIPVAHRLDTSDRFSSWFVIAGMLIMAISLLVLE